MIVVLLGICLCTFEDRLCAKCGLASCGGETIPYVGPDSCAACHRETYDPWSESAHALSMRPADRETVLGDFDDAVFSDGGTDWSFHTREDRFLAVRKDAAGERVFEVDYVVGFDPIQQYVVRDGEGRRGILPVCWNVRGGRGRWSIPRARPGRSRSAAPFHGDPSAGIDACVSCHATDVPGTGGRDEAVRPGGLPESVNVSCEACHGPAGAHLDWARCRDDGDEPENALESGLTVDLKRGDSAREVEACARCHSRRQPLRPSPPSGEPFLDGYMPALLEPGLYFADGQIQGEVGVYGSFVQTAMYRAGVRCTDCHDPHGAETAASGDAVCVACHSEDPPRDRFASLPARDYRSAEHHYHPEGSASARCVACHMPARAYAGGLRRRDHSFRIPRADVAGRVGAPDACTTCHPEQGYEWSAGVLDWLYGIDPDDREGVFADAIAAGRERRPEAVEDLEAVATDPAFPGIVRATAADLLAEYEGIETTRRLERLLEDEDPLVRAAAPGLFARLGRADRIRLLVPLLRDPLRAVRIAAVRALGNDVRGELSREDRLFYDRALGELNDVPEPAAPRDRS